MGAPVLVPAYVALGSNLDDPPAQLRAAFDALARLPSTRLVARSSFYQNPPMGPAGQPDFVNAVAALLTALPAAKLLAGLQQIETSQGRRHDGPRWGPRTLDLDLLMHGNLQLDSDTLTLPHPGLAERPFVLVPLLEVAPGLRTPGGELVARLAARVRSDDLTRLDD